MELFDDKKYDNEYENDQYGDDKYLEKDEDVDTVMDADIDDDNDDDDEDQFDEDDEELLHEREQNLAAYIVEQCQGVDEDGSPNCAMALSVSTFNTESMKSKNVAQAAFCNAVVTVNKRYEFLEIILDFKTKTDSELRVMWADLQKYGRMLNDTKDTDPDVPTITISMVPLSGLGTCFMMLTDPTSWYLSATAPGADVTQIRFLVKCENVGFYETDEIDLADINAEVDREHEIEEAYREEIQQKAIEEEEIKAQNEELLESFRKSKIV